MAKTMKSVAKTSTAKAGRKGYGRAKPATRRKPAPKTPPSPVTDQPAAVVPVAVPVPVAPATTTNTSGT